MSGYNNNWSDESDFDNEGGSQGGGGLRKMLEDTLAENRRLAALLNDKREKSATALLSDKGIDPAFAKLIPADQDPAEWIAEYGPLIGVKQPVEKLEETKVTPPEMQHSDDNDPAIVAHRAQLEAERKALEEMQNAAEQGLPASVHDDLVTKMGKIESEDDLLKFFKENGAPLD